MRIYGRISHGVRVSLATFLIASCLFIFLTGCTGDSLIEDAGWASPEHGEDTLKPGSSGLKFAEEGDGEGTLGLPYTEEEDGIPGLASSEEKEGMSGLPSNEGSIGNNDMGNKTAWDVVGEMKVGWNLGNTLDSTDGSILRALNPRNWETAWGNPITTEELIHTIIDSGFNVIRIPVSWNDHIYLNDNYRIEESWMDRVQEIVDYAYHYGAYVILNTHHEAWYYPYYDNEERASAILEAVWKQIADRFEDYDERLIFEGMNEPRKVGTPKEWNGGDEEGWTVVNRLNRVFVDTVRSSGGNNPGRVLMVTSYAANAWAALKHLEVPEGDLGIAVSVHAYEPYDFALNIRGRGLWNQETEQIDMVMNSLNELFVSKGIPVILGEFGAMYKPVEGNEEERAKWARYYVSAAREIGVPCIWWDNGAFEGEGELFGLIDRETYLWKYTGIVEALMEGSSMP